MTHRDGNNNNKEGKKWRFWSEVLVNPELIEMADYGGEKRQEMGKHVIKDLFWEILMSSIKNNF